MKNKFCEMERQVLVGPYRPVKRISTEGELLFPGPKRSIYISTEIMFYYLIVIVFSL